MGGGRQADGYHRERRRVLLGIVMAAAVMVAAASATWLLSASITFDDALDGRLRLGTIAALLPAGVVAIHVARIATRRFNSPDRIAGAAFDAPGSGLSLDKAVLSNSVEQAVIAIPTYMLLALVLPVEQLVAVPVLAVLFAAGRMFFALRYKWGPGSRSFGFALTFYPTVAGMVAVVAMLIV